MGLEAFTSATVSEQCRLSIEYIDLFAVKGTDGLEDDTIGESLGNLFGEYMVGDDIRLHTELRTQVVFVILYACVHTGCK